MSGVYLSLYHGNVFQQDWSMERGSSPSIEGNAPHVCLCMNSEFYVMFAAMGGMKQTVVSILIYTQ